MSLSGSPSTSTQLVQLQVSYDHDPARANRLAQLLFSPSTELIVGVSS